MPVRSMDREDESTERSVFNAVRLSGHIPPRCKTISPNHIIRWDAVKAANEGRLEQHHRIDGGTADGTVETTNFAVRTGAGTCSAACLAPWESPPIGSRGKLPLHYSTESFVRLEEFAVSCRILNSKGVW